MKKIVALMTLFFAFTAVYSLSGEKSEDLSGVLEKKLMDRIMQETRVNTHFRNLLLETADTDCDASFTISEVNEAFTAYIEDIQSKMLSNDETNDRFVLLYDRNNNGSLEMEEFLNAWFNLDGCVRYRRSYGGRSLNYDEPILRKSGNGRQSPETRK